MEEERGINLAGRAEIDQADRPNQILLTVPVIITVALGEILIGGRFILMLKQDLKQSPDNWAGLALLTFMVGSILALALIASLAVGGVVRLILKACLKKPGKRVLGRAYRAG